MTDPDKIKKIKTWEEAQLSKDDVIIAARIFDSYMMDADSLAEDDVILQKIGKKIRAPGFYVIHGGELLGKADGMPKSSKIYSCLKKCVSRVYETNLDKIVREVVSINKEIEKIESSKDLLQQKLLRMKEGDKEKKDVLAEMESLLEQEKTLKAKVESILSLEQKKGQVAKK